MTNWAPHNEPSELFARDDDSDMSRRREAYQAGPWLKAIVENSADAILSKTLGGIIMTWNAGAEKLFGYTAREAIGQPITIIIPEDRLHEEEDIIRQLRADKRVDQFETVRRRKDGSLVDVALTVSPVKDEAGNILGAAKIARDITASRQAAIRQDLIIHEMNHRIKNLFALTTSLVALSARGTDNTKELVQDLTARLQSLSRAHALILPNFYEDVAAGTGTTLAALLTEVLAPHNDAAGSRIAVAGAPVVVGQHALPTLSLLFHELATNAVKYGALASGTGRLSINVAIAGEDAEILWQESGAPERENVTPKSGGFGSRLEQAGVATLRGKIDRVWHEHGLDILLVFPLAQIAHR